MTEMGVMSNNQINLTSAEALIRKKAGDQAEMGIELLKVCAETVQLISTSSALPGMFSTGEPIKSQNQPSQISAHAHLTNYALYSQKLADSFVGRFEEMLNISLIVAVHHGSTYSVLIAALLRYSLLSISGALGTQPDQCIAGAKTCECVLESGLISQMG
nr:unnamed protein product [Timema douglasi]